MMFKSHYDIEKEINNLWAKYEYKTHPAEQKRIKLEIFELEKKIKGEARAVDSL